MNNQIPVLLIEADTLPEVWEKAVVSVWQNGLAIKTEYDKPGDPPSKDCTMIMTARRPYDEPRIHRAFPGGLEDLEVYRQEVVDGVHDHWINPEEGKWTYTYHKRFFAFGAGGKVVDQVNYMVEKLAKTPYSRRAQAITWSPTQDCFTDDPPCLQRLWCRITEGEGNKWILNMNTHWRSRDAYKAAFMNIFALTDLQRSIAERISKIAKRPVDVGRYTDITDSFHIYGSYHVEFENFLNLISKRSFKDRTWTTDFAKSYFEDAKQKLLAEVK